MEGLKTADKEKSQQTSRYTTIKARIPEKQVPVDFIRRHKISKEYVNSGITIGVAETLAEIEEIRPLWRQMQNNELSRIPNVDYEHYISVIESFGGRAEPFVMYFKRAGKALAMVVGRIEKNPVPLKVGYLTLLSPKLKCLNITYGGIMGRPDEKLSSLMINELAASLKFGKADAICFNHLRTDTAFYKTLKNKAGFLRRDVFPKKDEHWRMSVPNRMDKFYSSRSHSHRHNLRRAVSKFDHDYAGDIRYVNYTNKDEVDDFLKLAAHISKKTYQHELSSGLANDESTRTRLKAAASNGWFRGHILYAGGKSCAFQLGLRYGNVYYMVNIGYDPAFKTYKPGLILFLKVLEGLCDDPLIETVDFYFGDAQYKRRYGTEHWQEASICLFAQRVYPMFINALRATTMGVDAGLKYTVNKIGFADMIKRKWRNLLSVKAAVRGKNRSSLESV
ncbi:MAG: GNAT family N-acetyltransferase [Sedimentisphaerales bacterium]|nr:GNAT family N-acetyltransferase [Sedimentisphaerales bacterium]